MDEAQEIGARNFVLCGGVTFDAKHPEAPYTLHRLLSTVRAVDTEAMKSSLPIYAYVEYFGAAGEYQLWIDVVAIEYDERSEEAIEDIATYGPFDLNLRGDSFVEGRFYCLRHLPLTRTGICEFRVKLAGVFETVILQRLYVEE